MCALLYTPITHLLADTEVSDKSNMTWSDMCKNSAIAAADGYHTTMSSSVKDMR